MTAPLINAVDAYQTRQMSELIISNSLAGLAARIQQQHDAASSALKSAISHAIAAGELLLQAKEQLEHGKWLPWLQANCEIPERTVQAYIRLARLPIEKRNAVADLPLREALSAIRSRERQLPDAAAAEAQPSGRAEVVTVAPDGEVLPGPAALEYLDSQPPPSPPGPSSTVAEYADECIEQLDQYLWRLPDGVDRTKVRRRIGEMLDGNYVLGPSGDDDDGRFTLDDYFELAEHARKLEDRNRDISAALNAKEVQASRNWPADMKPKQLKQRDNCLKQIAAWQRNLEQLYGEVTGQPSWRVEVTTKDGARLGTGARFGTRGEAEFYNTHFASSQLGDDYASSEIVPCEKEKANVGIEGDTIRFTHGDCILLDWRPVGVKPGTTIDNDIDAATSAELMKTKHAALDTEGAAPPNDQTIPGFLRREATS